MALTCGVAKGGTAVNIILTPPQVHIGVRTLNVAARNHLAKRIPELVDGYVRAWRGSFEMTCFKTPSTCTDPEFCDALLPYIEGSGGRWKCVCNAAHESYGRFWIYYRESARECI